MKKFLILLPGSSQEQQAILQNLFAPTRASWWHWAPEVWLLKFVSETPTVQQLHGEIRAALPTSHFLVFSLDNSQYQGWGPTEWQHWFRDYWG
jgi:hypothetical protein